MYRINCLKTYLISTLASFAGDWTVSSAGVWTVSFAGVWTVSFALWLTASLPCIASEAPGASGQTSLAVKQFCEAGGEQQVMACSQGIKIANTRKAITVIFVPPYKSVAIYNDHNKCIFYCPLSKFKSPYAQSMAVLSTVTFADLKLSSLGKRSYNGIPAYASGFDKEYAQLQRARLERREISQHAPRAITLLETSKLKLDPEIITFLDRFYGLPPTRGWPLDLDYLPFKGSPHHYMHTTEIKEAKFKASQFSLPTGYKSVKDISQVLLDDAEEDSIEMIIGK